MTWLSADGSNKAPVDPQRKIFGPYRSGAVRLAPAGEKLAVAEGVETALSIFQATHIPTWAALTASNLRCVTIPECVRELLVCADGDAAGEQAAQALALRFMRERPGAIAKIARAGSGMDFNNLML